MKTTIIELLTMLANEKEMPQYIKFRSIKYKYSKYAQDYMNDEGKTPLFMFLFADDMNFLNEEVTILENEEITKWGKGAIEELETKELSLPELQTYLTLLMQTQNQIINRLEADNES